MVIHEGQLTFESDGLHLVEDPAWWGDHAGGPPLGLNLVRSDLEDLHGEGTLEEIAGLLEASVRHALDHRETSIDYAMRFGRGTGGDRGPIRRALREPTDHRRGGRRAAGDRTTAGRGGGSGLLPDRGDLVPVGAGSGMSPPYRRSSGDGRLTPLPDRKRSSLERDRRRRVEHARDGTRLRTAHRPPVQRLPRQSSRQASRAARGDGERLDVHVRAICVLDSSDHAVVRVVCGNADGARFALRQNGFTFSETDILVFEVPDESTLREACRWPPR